MWSAGRFASECSVIRVNHAGGMPELCATGFLSVSQVIFYALRRILLHSLDKEHCSCLPVFSFSVRTIGFHVYFVTDLLPFPRDKTFPGSTMPIILLPAKL